jgi:hypothetical protein
MKAVLSLPAVLLLCSATSAQETIALAIDGWRAETRDGVTYYRCASRICAAGATVSYKAQPHRTTFSLADFEKHHRGLADQNKGSGRIRSIRFHIADILPRTMMADIDRPRILALATEPRNVKPQTPTIRRQQPRYGGSRIQVGDDQARRPASGSPHDSERQGDGLAAPRP